MEKFIVYGRIVAELERFKANAKDNYRLRI